MIDDRFELAATADEREILTCFLDYQRQALMRKCSGLDDKQMKMHSVPSSNLTLLGLVRHLAGVERWYFQSIIAGQFPGNLYNETGEDDEQFDNLDTTTAEIAFGEWRAEVEKSRQIASGLSLDATGTSPNSGQKHSLRWVMNHMIDEYARHNGHADIIREAIDGQTGE